MKPKTHRRQTPPERGAVAAEFALVLPLVLLLIFGMIEFGIAFQRFQTVHSAAREGARIGSVSSNAEAVSRCESTLDGTTFDGNPTCRVVSGDCSNHLGEIVVEATADNDINIPFFGNPTLTLTGRGQFRCE